MPEFGARRAWLGAAVLGGVVAGAVAALQGSPALIGGLAVVACLAVLGPRKLASLQIASVYVTRFRADVVGFRVLPEQLVASTMLVSAVLTGRVNDLLAAARSKPLALMGAFIAWGACISVVASPVPGNSLSIAAWLALSWLIAVNLVAFGGPSARVQRQIVAWAGVAAWVALVMYVGDRFLGTTVGLQPEPNTGSKALFGVAWEANILASSLAAALFLALSARREAISRRLLWLTAPAMIAAMLLALTRGAVLGLALGLLVWGVMSRGVAMRRIVAWSVLGGVLVAALAVVSPTTLHPVTEKLGLLVETNSGTGRNRVDLWKTALDDVGGVSSAVGLGLNSFGQRHLDPTRPDDPTPAYLGSLPLQVFYDTGLIGALLLACALASMWPRSREARRRATGLLVVVFVSTTATSTLWFGSTWALVALAVLGRAGDGRPPRDTDVSRTPTALSDGSRRDRVLRSPR
jgi:hypothetical protein